MSDWWYYYQMEMDAQTEDNEEYEPEKDDDSWYDTYYPRVGAEENKDN